MEFSVGQTLIHPYHGAGKVLDIENKELVEGFEHYYVIHFEGNELTTRIPVRNADDFGLRSVMSDDKFDRAMAILSQEPEELPSHFKSRRAQVEDMIRSGQPIKIAEAVRDLTWRKKDEHLTKADRRLLMEGKDLLVDEMSLVTDSDPEEVRVKMEEALAEAVKIKRATENGSG